VTAYLIAFFREPALGWKMGEASSIAHGSRLLPPALPL